MAKYCKSCGEEYTGNYCEKCGYGKPVEKSKTFEKYKTNREKKQEKLELVKAKGKEPVSPQRIAILVIAIVAVVGLILWALYRDGIISGGDKTEPVVSYFEAIAENDYEKYVSAMPDAIAESYDEYMSKNGLNKDTYIKESYSDYHEILGDTFTAQVNCGVETKLSKSETADAEDNFSKNFGDDVNFREAYCIHTEVKYSGDKDTQSFFYDVYVAKIGFHWYIINVEDYYEQ